MIYESPCVYSFGSSNKNIHEISINNNINIGPSKYNPKTQKQIVKSFSFSKSPKSITNSTKTPGPGEYIKEIGLFGKNVPKYTISKTKRVTLFDILSKRIEDNKIGPGEYEKEFNINRRKGRKGILSRGKEKIMEKFITPGPGEYSISEAELKNKRTQPKYKIGLAKRELFGIKDNDFNFLGPGYYKIPCTIGHVPDYTKSKFKKEFKYV